MIYIKSFEEIENLLSYKNLINVLNTNNVFNKVYKDKWVYNFDDNEKDRELIKDTLSYVKNNKIKELLLEISGIKYNIQKEYRCIKDYYDEKVVYCPINYKEDKENERDFRQRRNRIRR